MYGHTIDFFLRLSRGRLETMRRRDIRLQTFRPSQSLSKSFFASPQHLHIQTIMKWLLIFIHQIMGLRYFTQPAFDRNTSFMRSLHQLIHRDSNTREQRSLQQQIIDRFRQLILPCRLFIQLRGKAFQLLLFRESKEIVSSNASDMNSINCRINGVKSPRFH